MSFSSKPDKGREDKLTVQCRRRRFSFSEPRSTDGTIRSSLPAIARTLEPDDSILKTVRS